MGARREREGGALSRCIAARLDQREAVREVTVVHLLVVAQEGEPPGAAAADVVYADVVQHLFWSGQTDSSERPRGTERASTAADTWRGY